MISSKDFYVMELNNNYTNEGLTNCPDEYMVIVQFVKYWWN